MHSAYLGVPGDLLHPADPVVGISPHGDNQGVFDVLARWALLTLTARSVPVLYVLVDPILEPVLGDKSTLQQGRSG